MDKTVIQYSIIVPIYNEELVINEAYKRLKKVMNLTEETYEIIFVNDGSRDRSFDMVKDICNKDKNIRLIRFSRNFGHQLAITAGMNKANGKAVIVIDADLQDPPEIMLKMIEKWKEGYEVVYGKRLSREGETFFKKITSKAFYRTLRVMTDVDIPVDTGDFRLIDRKVCEALKRVPERNRYVRGIISWLGFKQTGVEFEREERIAGETKYPLNKMVKFALDAIISFSYKPLKLASITGFSISIFSFLYLMIVVFKKIFINDAINGWTSIVALSLFFNGLVLIILGIIGEYIGRIYDEVKGRPLYIIDEKVGF
ncbi:glycosyltransferase family 2 protein [Clostridium sp.]|uniref:glycosyltransferase family 2 protein n=1 Tax=Clostridium sp. TaxID=1506 RepID=UPI003F4C1BE8